MKTCEGRFKRRGRRGKDGVYLQLINVGWEAPDCTDAGRIFSSTSSSNQIPIFLHFLTVSLIQIGF